MKHYCDKKNLVIEDGVARPPLFGEDVSEITPFEQSDSYKKQEMQQELYWAIEEHEATNDAVLKWFVSGNEPIGLKAYRQNLENYFLAVAAGEKPTRPVLDDRTAIKKFWQLLNTPISQLGESS